MGCVALCRLAGRQALGTAVHRSRRCRRTSIEGRPPARQRAMICARAAMPAKMTVDFKGAERVITNVLRRDRRGPTPDPCPLPRLRSRWLSLPLAWKSPPGLLARSPVAPICDARGWPTRSLARGQVRDGFCLGEGVRTQGHASARPRPPRVSLKQDRLTRQAAKGGRGWPEVPLSALAPGWVGRAGG